MGRSVLVCGADGMLGAAVKEAFRAGFKLHLTDVGELDITDATAVDDAVRRIRPEIILNLAAYTDVDRAESEPEKCMKVNGTGAGNLARAAKKINATIVYISTDYIFDGTKSAPYSEDDAPNPLGVYGKSKLAGEEKTHRSGARFLIVRTSWLFGKGGVNFVEKILRRARMGEDLRVVDDQIGAPTYTRHFAEGLEKLVSGNASGIYNATASGSVSWCGFTREILALAGLKNKIAPVKTGEFPAAAKRPLNSRLDNSKFTAFAGAALPPWREGLEKYFAEMNS